MGVSKTLLWARDWRRPQFFGRKVEAMSQAEVPVHIDGLTKRFGKEVAVDNVDLTVHRGSVHGFLGPNGAGKSTTLRALLGLLRPDAGTIRLLGIDPTVDPAAATKKVAYVPGDVALWPQLTGAEALATLAKIRGADSEAFRKKRAAFVERFQLDPTKKIRQYSKGNRQKVMLVAAFSAGAEVLVFDEPTSGLDPLMEREFNACVREARDQGAAVLLSSHILSEVQELADDITIINAGRIVESGSLAELSHLRGSRLTYTLPDGHRVEDLVDRAEVPGRLQAALAEGATDITCTESTLEDIFLSHYHEQAR